MSLGAQPSTSHWLEFQVEAGKLPLLFPDVENLQKKEQHEVARKGGLR